MEAASCKIKLTIWHEVWHEGLIYKIKSILISGPLLKLIESYQSSWYQQVLLNVQSSTRLQLTFISILICLSKRQKTKIFSCKTHKIGHPKVNFNNSFIVRFTCQKHLGMHLDEKLIFFYHTKDKPLKVINAME